MLSIMKAYMPVVKAGLRKFFTKENGEVNIVATVILIGIAVVLAIVFKDFIGNLLKSLFGKINEQSENVFDKPEM